MAPRAILLALAGGALLLAAGCDTLGTCKYPLTDAAAPEIAPLKMPVGLDGPGTDQALKIPPLKQPEAARAPGARCLEEPPVWNAPGAPPLSDVTAVGEPTKPHPAGRPH